MSFIFVKTPTIIARPTNIGVYKIDGLLFRTYEKVSANILLQNCLETMRFFKQTFLFADNNIEVILGILFLFLRDTNIKFGTVRFT